MASSSMITPPLRLRAPATPAPMAKVELAALTTASTWASVMSPRSIAMTVCPILSLIPDARALSWPPTIAPVRPDPPWSPIAPAWPVPFPSPLKRRRNLSIAPWSAASASIEESRATLTTENRRSPSSSPTCAASPEARAALASSISSSTFAQAAAASGQSNLTRAALLCMRWARVNAGSAPGTPSSTDRSRPSGLSLALLDGLPLGEGRLRAGHPGLAEDVRMAIRHLVAHATEDVGHVERALLGPDLRVEHDLEEEVPQLLDEGTRHRTHRWPPGPRTLPR